MRIPLAQWTAIPRYGTRIPNDAARILEDLNRRGQFVQGPHIAAFEDAFASRLGVTRALTTSYGRMAFFHLLKAYDFPPGSEIVIPAITFWVVPELARVAGLVPVFADVEAGTHTLDPESLARVITPRTRAVVPTHLWGLPCDMDAIMAIADRHRLVVIEDCAHALGATFRGQPVGTIGHAGFFSFQTLKPLNTFGGGMAVSQDRAIMDQVALRLSLLPTPGVKRVRRQLRSGRLQQAAIQPRVFSVTAWPVLWLASWFHADVSVYIWDAIRPLMPLPPEYLLRYSNAQAALGLAGLDQLDAWTATSRAHAARLDELLRAVPGLTCPRRHRDRAHVYYQYCIEVARRDAVVRRAVRRGIDLETLHVDVCTDLALFAGSPRDANPGAARAQAAIQVPVYSSLSSADIDRIAGVVAEAARETTTAAAAHSEG